MLLAVIVGCGSSSGQNDDSDQNLLGGASFVPPRELRLEDLDGDGDLDLLTVHSAGRVCLTENVGEGKFREPREFGPDLKDIERLADLNGDSDLAVGGTHSADAYVDWFENTGGSWQRHALAVGAGLVGNADWDGDVRKRRERNVPSI